MTWHLDRGTADGYVAGRLGEAHACSAEAHLLQCADCRHLLTSASASGGRAGVHDRTWRRLLDDVDQPSGWSAERWLTGLVPRHVVRLVVTAPALRHALLVAGAAVLVAAVLASHLGRGAAGTVLFLVTAPVLPLLGVALAYSWPDDVAGDVAPTLPYSRFRLLLLRTTAVVGVTVPVIAMLGIALPIDVRLAMLWLAPAVALCSMLLALSTVVDAGRAAAALTAVWLMAVLPGTRTAPRDLLVEQVLQRSVLFRPSGQVVLLCVAAVAVLVTFLRRSAFDTWSPA